MSDDQRRAWQEFWRRNVEKFPTDYSKINNGEGFAEAYEFFRNDMNLDDEIRQLLEKLVGPNPKGVDDLKGGDDQEGDNDE